jgi:phytoene synthase
MIAPWTADVWTALDRRVRQRAENADSEQDARREIRVAARSILRAFSSSFFLVTRFLPARKRLAVDVIYAAVRYPDEIVDTFPISNSASLRRLDTWEAAYVEAVASSGLRYSIRAGIPWILAGFAEVIREHSIPLEHYHAFLLAMRRDVSPRPFHTMNDLIDGYVYGSATVVGYFLAHVYGVAAGSTIADAYACACDLGIALQLTNFARDVAEDGARGRLYVPRDIVDASGLRKGALFLAETAEARYERAVRTLDAFAADTRPAIRACIDVYRLLNRRILAAGGSSEVRQSVPISQKLSALPSGKYWRVPLAWLGAL